MKNLLVRTKFYWSSAGRSVLMMTELWFVIQSEVNHYVHYEICMTVRMK